LVRRKLEALRRAGAGKAEIVAELEKYIKDLDWFHELTKFRMHIASSSVDNYEVRFLRMEAEIWLNEEKARNDR
jgi:flavin-binding protein dodecin